ncbi:MAG: FAD-dependent oxidoreductase [Gammaproteobacteria bacterium]|nr:FAD-dependent oxidoreductase [Gammaproteobacteria bacterium]
MTRDTRYDILFEPIDIGPVTAKNRFYQVPHCNGGGYRDPSAVAEMRRIKAEGGWGVVFTEQVELHHTSEITPFIELRLWDDEDVPMLARMADAIHSGEALAGIELAYSGVNGPNLYTREVPMAPTAMPIRTFTNDPVQARSMTLADIRDLRRWHRNALRRAKTAGYDLACLYAAHGFGVIQHFLSSATNQRTDDYGGSLENRSRLMRELISDARDEVGDTMAITLRLALHEMVGTQGLANNEVRDLIAMHSDLPDLWDLAHGTWEECSGASRFAEEAAQESLISGIRELTDKPVVGVGRFTSPDVMARQIRAGVLDLIGCARPSIADPYLPRKIDEGRVEDIRECIGCNMCITGDMTMSISRCTQNPTFMEEWRKGWHPEQIESKGGSSTVLVVGAGPSGLEAARALGERGYEVMLAEKNLEAGGRVALESQLPGLSAWARVRDYRLYQISQMPNVNLFLDNELSATDVLEIGSDHVCIATGASWRTDGVARHHLLPIPGDGSIEVLTPDDLMAGRLPAGRVVVYDDDHYYMGAVCAELLADKGCTVSLITPSAYVSEWSLNTLEQGFVHQKLAEKGVSLCVNQAVSAIVQGVIEQRCVYTSKIERLPADAIVMVTARVPDDSLYRALLTRNSDWADQGINSVRAIGDAEAPAPIAWATYAGHRYARELDAPVVEDVIPFRRELAGLRD